MSCSPGRGGNLPGKTAVPAAAPTPSAGIVVTERDIVFECSHCSGELVIDREGVGLTLACSHCGKNVIVPGHSTITPRIAPGGGGNGAAPAVPAPVPATEVPAAAPPPAPAETPPASAAQAAPDQTAQRASELRRQLKENRSQTTEMRGHVNRATIELHRLQLKLQKLVDCQTGIEADLAEVEAALKPSGD